MYKFSILLSFIILCSCNNSISPDLINQSNKASNSNEDILVNPMKNKINPFYFNIPYDPKSFTIQVIFEDESGVRINKENNKFVIENNDTAKKLNEILIKHNVVRASDLTYSGMPEEKVIEDKNILEKAYGEGFPSRYSIQSYTFPKDNLKDVIEEIKKLPYVVSVSTVGHISIH